MTSIHDLPRIERPREKLLKYGTEKLTTAELLAIILRTGTKNLNVLQLATRVLKILPMDQFSHSRIDELTKIRGLGTVKACEIIACLELGKRLFKYTKPMLAKSPQAVFDSLEGITRQKKEHFIAIYLDSRNKELSREVISIGILNASLVHPREVFEPAIRQLANTVIVVHNHPSGDLTPSRDDLILTKRLAEAGRLLDIPLTDHLIITTNGYLSFKEQGLL